ncbi:MAG: nitrile hydratase subunit alpha [Schwartzia sp.]|nr:nitrile hydratase subunit alpha [Schwartzia sp. (in: firmicutes)]MBO6235226.1 nitrile hydratase subunit alpha [Schwartzia sp. (in: firmicutes)]MBP3690268.1 nitrile hydratase subunit alpha [Schwartzia sp. (in: firmicutes)]
MADKKQNLVKYGEIISKCWEDDAYKKRFIEDPESVLAEAGFAVEEGVTYKVIEQPKMVRYVVIPYEGAQDAVQTFTKYLLNAAEKKDVIIPEGAEARIIQNTEDVRYMILPASPKSLSKAELAMAAGGDAAAVNVVTAVVSDISVSVTPTTTVTPTAVAMPTTYVEVVSVSVAVLI